MRHVHGMVAAGVLLLAGAAQAAPVSYSGTATGNKVGELAPRAGNKIIGTSRCANNEVTVEVTVDGASVTGIFREKHAEPHQFATTRDASGAFKVNVPRAPDKGASSGGPSHSGLDDSMIHVRGVINEGGGQINIEDSCLFKATLTKK